MKNTPHLFQVSAALQRIIVTDLQIKPIKGGKKTKVEYGCFNFTTSFSKKSFKKMKI